MSSSADNERHLLACLLGDGDDGSVDAYLEVCEVVQPRDMYEPRHELLLGAIYAQHEAHQPVNALTVGDRLASTKDLTRVGGRAYIAQLVGMFVSRASAGYYADKIRIASALRAVESVGVRLQQLGQAEGVEDMTQVLDIVDASRATLDAVATHDTHNYDHRDAAFHALEILESGDRTPVPTPWKALNDALGGGWRRGALYYAGARPGVGKSILGLNAAVDMARRGFPSCVFSMEMTVEELHHRMLSHVGSVDATYLQKRSKKLLDPDVWTALSDASAHIAALPMVIDDTPVQTLSSIRAQLRSTQRLLGPLGLVVVDYVQIMEAVRSRENRQQEVSGISRGLKVLAKDFDVPVLVLSQLNRNGASGKPSMTDLRESGSLEQDGDVVMLLHVDDDAPDTMEITIPKNRHGRAGSNADLYYQPHYMRVLDRFGR